MQGTSSMTVWDEIFATQRGWGKYPPEYVVRWASKLARGARVLDVGSGPGANTWFLSREGFSVSALDASEVALGMLRQRMNEEHLSPETKLGDFCERIPWADRTFDAALDCCAIYANEFERAKQAVSEVHRVLKYGGEFLSATFSDSTDPAIFENRGFGLRLTWEQAKELYAPFDKVAHDSLTWTTYAGNHAVGLWITYCRKAKDYSDYYPGAAGTVTDN